MPKVFHYQCDYCKVAQEPDGYESLPAGWYILRRVASLDELLGPPTSEPTAVSESILRKKEQESPTFCSKTCFVAWATQQ